MLNNYSGVIPFYRQDFKDKMGLKDSEFKLWWVIISLFGWDSFNNPHLYGRVVITREDLAKYIGWSYDKVARVLKSLLKVKGIDIVKTDENTYECLDYDKYLINNAYKIVKEENELRKVKARQDATLHRKKLDGFVKTPINEAKLHTNVSKMQIKQEKNAVISRDSSAKALVSFKVSLIEESLEKKKLRLINTGLFTESELNELCFCKSGKKLIDCCAEASAYALSSLSNDEKTV